MTDTRLGFGASARQIILCSGIHFNVFGLAKTKPSSISWTKLAGSLTNFFMEGSLGWCGLEEAEIYEEVTGANRLPSACMIVAMATIPGSRVPALRSPVNDWRPRRAVHGLEASTVALSLSAASRRTAPSELPGS